MRKMFIILIAVFTIAFCACGTGRRNEEASAPAAKEPADPAATAIVQTTEEQEDNQNTATEQGAEEAAPADFSPEFTFVTTDRDGNTYSETVFSGYKLTVLNFWEPWCGPCVRELPDLQKLYENYSDKGLNIIGIYSTSGMEEDVTDILTSSGVTFPILHYADEFAAFETGYVPTTVLVDQSGHIVLEEPIIGSNSYKEWESVIGRYLA